ncbi:response regulator transcription factor [Bradyrhizobium brasilense]|uniref:response regulator transcription factor n=1 Tax=Bradyrhizobium brasilense TaxID=1419277 RepID=UPI00287803E2|nr:response regulator transcription factor [Bradyrhizobium brasilense]MCP3417931.1 response regulator transcription factor [Bradyrhizobium brasilense]
MIRVLLADDRIVVRCGLRGLLQTREDFDVCAEASDGREAIDLAVRHKPDVAILDMSLPVIDGIEATRQIRKETRTTEVMIFALHAGQAEIRAVLNAGARGFLLKSEPDDQIVKGIEALARHRNFFSNAVTDVLLPNNGGHDHLLPLTDREREVVRLIAEGKSNKNIAYCLDISAKTVETHRSASMRKLNVHSTAQLVRYAIRFRLIEP